MRAALALLLAAALALAGCGHLPLARHAVPRGGETITYHRQGASSCATCPSYTITIGPDGQGIFTGERNTAAAIGDHRFRAAPEQVAAFGRHLRPYRARASADPTFHHLCSTEADEHDDVFVTWVAAENLPFTLHLNGACAGDGDREMVRALYSAPALLPVADFIGAH